MTYSVKGANGNPNNSAGPVSQETADALSLERLAGDAILDHLTWSAATALRDDRRWLEQQAIKAELALALIAEAPNMLPSGDTRQARAEHLLRELVESLRTGAGAVRAASVALATPSERHLLPSISQSG